jgi:hypothetical protein
MSRHHLPQSRQQQLSKALAKMSEALEILDDLGAPGEIGSQLDLAIARLGKQLGIEDMPVPAETLIARLGVEATPGGAERVEPSSPWISPV